MAAHCVAAASLALGDAIALNVFKCLKHTTYSRTDLYKKKGDTYTRTASMDNHLRTRLGRLLLLKTPEWRKTKGRRKRCATQQKMGHRGGVL